MADASFTSYGYDYAGHVATWLGIGAKFIIALTMAEPQKVDKDNGITPH